MLLQELLLKVQRHALPSKQIDAKIQDFKVDSRHGTTTNGSVELPPSKGLNFPSKT